MQLFMQVLNEFDLSVAQVGPTYGRKTMQGLLAATGRGVVTGEHWGNIVGTLGEHWGNNVPPKIVAWLRHCNRCKS